MAGRSVGTAFRYAVVGWLACLTVGPACTAGEAGVTRTVVELRVSGSDARVTFAAEEVSRALVGAGWQVKAAAAGRDRPKGAWVIEIGIDPKSGTKPQSFALKHHKDRRITVTGIDARGAMYGGLELAEQIRLGKGPRAAITMRREPYILRRGLKMNFPLDARTPSYDDTGTAAQENIATMWDRAFWREFLDDMARYRYNTLTLWSCHPFPSMLRLGKYPGVALDDVCRLKPSVTFDHRTHREWNGIDIQASKNLRVIRKMTIAEKIAHWRWVMKHAKDRGIDVYLITWNIFVHAAAGKHGITNSQTNDKTIAYMRECVKEFLLTYPDLKGMGVTTGEHMRKLKGEYSKERWMWKTYGLGILDAKKVQPERHVPFIFRTHQAGFQSIMSEFGRKYPDTFETSFKYARAHLYSSPTPPFFRKEYLAACKKHKVRCWMNLRNDDIFHFRWGDPDYVRLFLLNLQPSDQVAGYHMGSDGYVWGREFSSVEPDTPRHLEIRKHWYRFLLWGRLGYDPSSLTREHCEKLLANRFPGADASSLYQAWQTASKIIPQVNRLHWRQWDFMLSPEICSDRQSGFRTVEQFADTKPMPGSGLISPKDYADALAAGRTPEGTTPPAVAKRLDMLADAVIRQLPGVRGLPPHPSDKELRRTLADLEAFALLGRYYAAKIRGAVALARFRRSGDKKLRDEAVRELTDALARFRDYAALAAKRYKPQLLARTRRSDWKKLTKEAARDIDLARRAKAPGNRRR